MPLSFLVATDQEMLIVDAETTPQIPVSADALKPTHAYNVFAFLQNTDPLDHRDIEVTAWHDTFGIGIREKALAIVQPEPITVPGRRGDTPGVAAVNFSLVTPPSGRGRLALKVVPYGPALVQPVKIVAPEARPYGGRVAEHPSEAMHAARE